MHCLLNTANNFVCSILSEFTCAKISSYLILNWHDAQLGLLLILYKTVRIVKLQKAQVDESCNLVFSIVGYEVV